ncbi:hypothetical protein D3C81_1039730 [compost metagenome]
MTGNVRQVESDASLVDAEIVGKIARQVQRRNDLVLERQLVGHPGTFRQHVHLHLAPGGLILLQQVQTGLQFAVGGFELFPVTLVLQHQASAIQRTAHRMFQHRKVFQRLDQVVCSTQAQRLYCIVHDPGTGDHDHRQFGRALGHLANQLQAAHLRHAQIADHKIRVFLFEDLEALLAIGCLQDAETAVFQVGGKTRTYDVVVIDYQQRCTGFLHVGKRRQN